MERPTFPEPPVFRDDAELLAEFNRRAAIIASHDYQRELNARVHDKLMDAHRAHGDLRARSVECRGCRHCRRWR